MTQIFHHHDPRTEQGMPPHLIAPLCSGLFSRCAAGRGYMRRASGRLAHALRTTCCLLLLISVEGSKRRHLPWTADIHGALDDLFKVPACDSPCFRPNPIRSCTTNSCELSITLHRLWFARTAPGEFCFSAEAEPCSHTGCAAAMHCSHTGCAAGCRARWSIRI